MKYIYQSRIPTVLFLNGKLETISLGQEVELDSAPSKDFELVEAPKPKKKKKVSSKPKVELIEEVDAISTDISELGE